MPDGQNWLSNCGFCTCHPKAKQVTAALAYRQWEDDFLWHQWCIRYGYLWVVGSWGCHWTSNSWAWFSSTFWQWKEAVILLNVPSQDSLLWGTIPTSSLPCSVLQGVRPRLLECPGGLKWHMLAPRLGSHNSGLRPPDIYSPLLVWEIWPIS